MSDTIKVEHQGFEYLGYVLVDERTGQFVPWVQIRDMTLSEPMYEDDTIDGPRMIGDPGGYASDQDALSACQQAIDEMVGRAH